MVGINETHVMLSKIQFTLASSNQRMFDELGESFWKSWHGAVKRRERERKSDWEEDFLEPFAFISVCFFLINRVPSCVSQRPQENLFKLLL